MEIPPSQALGNGHQQVHKEPNAGNSDARVVLVLAREINVFGWGMVVVVPNAMGVGRVFASTVGRGHC